MLDLLDGIWPGMVPIVLTEVGKTFINDTMLQAAVVVGSIVVWSCDWVIFLLWSYKWVIFKAGLGCLCCMLCCWGCLAGSNGVQSIAV